MVRSPLRAILVIVTLITLAGGCERKPRAREREAAEAEVKARAQAREAARRAAEPLPEEPPVETLRAPNSGLPCKVDDVFAAKCRRCHTIPTRHGAPLVFLTWDDTRQDRLGQPLYSVIGRAVRSGFMPYRVDAKRKSFWIGSTPARRDKIAIRARQTRKKQRRRSRNHRQSPLKSPQILPPLPNADARAVTGIELLRCQGYGRPTDCSASRLIIPLSRRH